MILAPVGALTVAAIGAWALMSPGGETAAPAETAALISAPAASDSVPLIEGEGSGTTLALDGPAAETLTTATPSSAPIPAEPAPAVAPAPRTGRAGAGQSG